MRSKYFSFSIGGLFCFRQMWTVIAKKTFLNFLSFNDREKIENNLIFPTKFLID